MFVLGIFLISLKIYISLLIVYLHNSSKVHQPTETKFYWPLNDLGNFIA